MEGRLIKGQIGAIGGAECSPEIYEIARPEVALTKRSPLAKGPPPAVWPKEGGITLWGSRPGIWRGGFPWRKGDAHQSRCF
jgi:hypothetical protein